MKSSKDLYHSLESNKTLSHNISSLDRAITSSNKQQNTPHSWCHQPKTPSPKLNIFF